MLLINLNLNFEFELADKAEWLVRWLVARSVFINWVYRVSVYFFFSY